MKISATVTTMMILMKIAASLSMRVLNPSIAVRTMMVVVILINTVKTIHTTIQTTLQTTMQTTMQTIMQTIMHTSMKTREFSLTSTQPT